MNRADRRRIEKLERKAGGVILSDPEKEFRLKYDLSTPGGPLRSPFPAQTSGVLTAETEADIMRGIIVKMIESFGYLNVGRAITGCFAEIINPLSMQLRQMILMQIAQGTGLLVTVQDVTTCQDCGAEQDVYDLLDPNAEDGAEMEQQDNTVHAEDCPKTGWQTAPAVMVLHPNRYQPIMTPPSAEEQPENVIEPEPESNVVPINETVEVE